MRKIKTINPYEFELDLAPLLAVMVKLVPVLLLSSAFVQVMTVETELPQVVKEAIANPPPDSPQTTIQLKASPGAGFTIIVLKSGNESRVDVPLAEGTLDFNSLHKSLLKVKEENPQVFKLEISPDDTLAYKDVVRITDEARRSRDKDIRFPIFDKTENKMVTTDFMFPEVVFTNIFDG